MKLHGEITINGVVCPAGADVPWTRIYPFSLFHMLIFGLSGFWMAYGLSPAPIGFLFMHGVIAISVYVIFLIRHMVLDLAGVGGDAARKTRVEAAYIGSSVLVYAASWLAH